MITNVLSCFYESQCIVT